MYVLRICRQVLGVSPRSAGSECSPQRVPPARSTTCGGIGLRRCGARLAPAFLVVATTMLGPSAAFSQGASPPPRPDEQFSFMKLLNEHGLHDTENETWNAYGQFTYISSWKPQFPALSMASGRTSGTKTPLGSIVSQAQ